MHVIDYTIVAVYIAVQAYLGYSRRLKHDSTAADLILGGRTLTLPAFVASLVSTWYGGILGVGEYSYRYGISNWLVFGLPYYLAAFLFAMFLARKARQAEVLTIPERLAQVYDNKTAVAGGIVIYFMTIPAAYIVMLGVLCQYLFGWPMWLGVLAGSLFSVCYVFTGGFKSVVRTDLLQFGLMYPGFIVLLILAMVEFGGPSVLISRLPESHLTWSGGNSGWYVAVWYVIALATLIEPAFFQRCYAARTADTARRGILISIACWAAFDLLTTTTGLYARAMLPDLVDPVASYPALATRLLPVGLMGLFALTMLSIVMSTVDSYSFLAASTFGNDIVPRVMKDKTRRITLFTKIGLVASTSLAVVLALFFRSVVDIWHAFGSIGTPALLVPVFTSFVGRRRLRPSAAFSSVIISGGVSSLWYLSASWTSTGTYWLDLEPIFPGLLCSLVIFGLYSHCMDRPSLPPA